MTDSDDATELPARKNAYDYDDLIECGHGGLFGPTNGRLPKPNMLMTDRITLITEEGGKYGKGEIKAEFDIHPDLWFFECHFESDPVMPGCLGLDALWQLVGFLPRLAGARRAAAARSVLARSSSPGRFCRRRSWSRSRSTSNASSRDA